MVQTPLLGFQRLSHGLFVPSPGGLTGFQRQGMDQRKKASSASSLGGTWDPLACDPSIALSNGNRRAAGLTAGTFANVHSATAHSAGKWYLEVTNVFTQAQSGGAPGVGFVIPGFATGTYLENGGGTTYTTYSEARDDANASITALLDVWNQAGDVFCIAADLDNRRVWGRKAGGNWNGNGGDPASNVGGFVMGASAGVPGQSVVLAAMPYANTVAFDLNVGGAPFVGVAPSGFSTW